MEYTKSELLMRKLNVIKDFTRFVQVWKWVTVTYLDLFRWKGGKEATQTDYITLAEVIQVC